MADWTNSDGLEIRFKNPEAGQTGATVETDGAVKELVVTLDYANNITAAADGHEAFIPAGSQIVNAYLIGKTAMTGTSGTIKVGLSSKDGSTLTDDDAILTATLGTQANLAAQKSLLCDGAAAAASSGVFTNFSATVDGYVYTTKGGTVTGGTGKLVIRYIDKNG
jgi:hypothetical protein